VRPVRTDSHASLSGVKMGTSGSHRKESIEKGEPRNHFDYGPTISIPRKQKKSRERRTALESLEEYLWEASP